MRKKIPQYSDAVIRFEDLHYNVVPTGIDLTEIDTFICSVAKSRVNASGVNLVQIEYPASSGRFTINNEDKFVDVQFLSTEIGEDTGCYYTNLWLVKNGVYMTHVVKEFEIVQAVTYA